MKLSDRRYQRLAAAHGQPEILRTFTVSLRVTLVIELRNGESSTSSSSDNNQNPAVRMPKRLSCQTESSSRIRASPSCFFIWCLDFTVLTSFYGKAGTKFPKLNRNFSLS
jgi:hypothetical protein